MELTIVVCTKILNNTHKINLHKCIKSIEENIVLNNDTQIIIVDSDSLDKSYMDEYKSVPFIRIENIRNKHYEGGAWYHVYKNYISKKYLFIQDSCQLTGPIDYLNDKIIATYNTFDTWFGTTEYEVEWVKNSFLKTKWKTVPEPFVMIMGCNFYCHRDVLDCLNLNGFFNSFPTQKTESCAYERYLGAALTAAGYINLIKQVRTLPISKINLHRE